LIHHRPDDGGIRLEIGNRGGVFNADDLRLAVMIQRGIGGAGGKKSNPDPGRDGQPAKHFVESSLCVS
jgi:hypothetical protein